MVRILGLLREVAESDAFEFLDAERLDDALRYRLSHPDPAKRTKAATSGSCTVGRR